MAEVEPENQSLRRRDSNRISHLLRRISTRKITIKDKVKTIEPLKKDEDKKHWTQKAFVVSVFAQEAILFFGMLTLAYFLRFRKDLFNTFYFPLESCTDFNYGYPYLEDTDAKENTNIRINHKAFYCVTFLIPLLLLAVGELVFHYFNYRRFKTSTFGSYLMNSLPKRLFRLSSVFLIGIFITCIITDVIKLLAAKPRPHFLTVCEPNLDVCKKTPFTSDICKGSDTDAILEARFSFPSFYASHTMFIAVFAATYVHSVFKLKEIYTVKPVLVGISILLGFLGGFPRYQLNYNHGTDLLTGYIIGALVAFYLVFFVLHNFQEKTPKKTIIYKRIVPDMDKASTKVTEEENNENGVIEEEAMEGSRPYTHLPPVAINIQEPSELEVEVDQEEPTPPPAPPPPPPRQTVPPPPPPPPPPRMMQRNEAQPSEAPAGAVFVMPVPPPRPPRHHPASSTESSESESSSDYSDTEESSGEGGVEEPHCVVVSQVLRNLRAPPSPIPLERNRGLSEAYGYNSEIETEIEV